MLQLHIDVPSLLPNAAHGEGQHSTRWPHSNILVNGKTVGVHPNFSLVENVPRESLQKSLRGTMAEIFCADTLSGGKHGYRLRMWKSSSAPPSQMP
jgi:hypothetical protein